MDMRVYENLFIGRELRNRAGLLDRRAMARQARELLEVFDVDIDPQAHMRSLSVGLRQLVEIAKNSSGGAKVLLLDEPSSAISDREVERLYDVVNQLRDRGVAMLYTTHKMEEIRAIADRVVVLRDGGLVMDQPLPVVTDDDIVQAMIGRELNDLFPEVSPVGEETALEVKGLHVSGYPAAVDLSVRRGEILGLAGLVGAGRTELLEAMFGVRKSTAGAVSVAGAEVRRNSPAMSITHGMALVPEDRKGAGVVLTMNVLDNGSLPRLSSFTLGGWLRARGAGKGCQGGDVLGAAAQPRHDAACGDALGRQPAEGRPRAMADRARRRAPAGRADAWRRRRGTQRDLPHHHRARPGRHGGRHGVIRHAGDPQPLPPGAGHAGRSRCGRAESGGPLRA